MAGGSTPSVADVLAAASPAPTVLSSNYTLSVGDAAATFRSDGSAALTVTVPGNLPAGFNVGFQQWGTGAITFVASSGATKRGSGSVTTQYGFTNLIVGKNADGASAEFAILGGA